MQPAAAGIAEIAAVHWSGAKLGARLLAKGGDGGEAIIVNDGWWLSVQ